MRQGRSGNEAGGPGNEAGGPGNEEGRHGNEASRYPSRVSYGGRGRDPGEIPSSKYLCCLSAQILVTTKVVHQRKPNTSDVINDTWS